MDKIHVQDVINNNEIAIDNLADRDLDVIELSRRKEILGHDLKDTEEKLISLGELKAKENKDGFFSSPAMVNEHFWIDWCCCYMHHRCNSFLLPIITQFIGWVVSKILD